MILKYDQYGLIPLQDEPKENFVYVLTSYFDVIGVFSSLEEAERELKRCRAVGEIKETPPPRRSFFKMVFGRHDQ